ncbi:cysteine-rich CWC family protein [Caballeronia sp. BR00000012568055]|uniref:cysteine-rich CWC family protein n=1 Tax=Caballeronia sp. BR00000012568055 TaxID=2918761 RepID=UPI0023F935BE|nr:cysteine-rich CWC family protein [Caballeronia sp. BR00000012568055]
MNVQPEPGASAAESMQHCERCGAAFHCGAIAGDATCWCASLPALGIECIERLKPDARCLCPACLRDETAKQA